MPVNQRTLADLENEIRELGLKVDFKLAKNGKIKKTKKQCIEVLRDYYIYQKYGENVPLALRLMLQMDTPMLADRIHAKSPAIQEAVWNSPDWGFQEKINGCRMIIIFDPITGFHFYSRGVSVEDYLPIDYTDNIVHNADEKMIRSQVGGAFILDAEVICTNPKISTLLGKRGVITETQLQAVSALLALNPDDSRRVQEEEKCPLMFCIFDAIYYEDWLTEDCLAIPQIQREKVSKFLTDLLQEAGLNAIHLETIYDPEGKKVLYEEILENRGEGVVAKHKMGTYRPVESRSRNTWVKIKRSVQQSLTSTEYNDTIDAFVTGFSLGEEGKGFDHLVGAVHFSVWLTDEEGKRTKHEIARISSSLTHEMHQKFTVQDEDGNPVLHPGLYGKVAEIDGQAVSARSKRLSHATIIAWREDKDSEQCEMEEKFLNSMVM